MAAAPFLVGERIYLRSLSQEDCSGAYLQWFNDEQVCQFNGHHYFPYTFAEATAYVASVNESRRDFVVAIALRDDDRHIGNVALQNIDFISQCAEFAIVIGDKECWGQGFAQEAGRLILDHGFLALNLHRVYCGTTENNLAMRRLAEYLGMKEEGRRREAAFKNDRYLDVVEYGVLKNDYVASRRENATKLATDHTAGSSAS